MPSSSFQGDYDYVITVQLCRPVAVYTLNEPKCTHRKDENTKNGKSI